MTRTPRAALILTLAALAQACDEDPTPGQIARCRADAGVTLPQQPKIRSLYLDPSAFEVMSCTTHCLGLLRERNLDFVEIRRETLSGDRIDRISFAPSGSPRCAPPFRRRPNNYPPRSYQFRVPGGQCLVIEDSAPTPTAEAALVERVVPNADHPASIREVVRSDGVLLARVLDYRQNFIEIADVTCADVVRGFPGNTYRVVLDHVTDPR